MEVILKGKVKTKEWFQDENIKNFHGLKKTVQPGIGITPMDPREVDVCYVNVAIIVKFKNTNSEVVFKGQTLSQFKVRDNGIMPTTTFLYDLYIKGMQDFVNEFNTNTEDTSIEGEKFTVMTLEWLEGELKACITEWNDYHRKGFLSLLSEKK